MAVKQILASYSPEDVNINIAGVITVSGLSQDTFVQISKDQQNFITKVSSDGVVSRTHTGGRTYNLSLTLHSASESNKALTYLALADDVSKRAKFPVFVKDTLGSTLLFAPTAWIEQIPDTSFAADITDRAWVIKCANATLNVGGNSEASGRGEDTMSILANTFGGMLL